MSAIGNAGASTQPAVDVIPFFLDTPGGRIFAVHHTPEGARGHVLCVPSFNEEMNRCRSMVTLQARAFAEAGFGTLVIDPFGTGDSDGDYVDARWDAWLANIGAAFAWLEERGGCRALLGIRSGVLLAAEWLSTQAPASRPALLAWQPVTDGKQYFTQFLRMRIAANMDRTDLPKESTSLMREQLAQGSPVEVAGYEIHPELASALDARKLADFAPPADTPIMWLEQNTPTSNVPGPASAKALAAWQAKGITADVKGFDGQAFWQLHERALAPEAIAITTAWLTKTTGRA
jgi:exosortase A-associated hydrolase 2